MYTLFMAPFPSCIRSSLSTERRKRDTSEEERTVTSIRMQGKKEGLGTATSSATVRLVKERRDMQTSPPASITAAPIMEPWRTTCSIGEQSWQVHLIAHIAGPSDSPYAGGSFLLSIQFPATYPYRAPKVTFYTKVFHPNITVTGNIALDIFSHQWSPALTLSKVLESIYSLLADRKLDDPLAPDAAHMYQTDREKFESTARLDSKVRHGRLC